MPGPITRTQPLQAAQAKQASQTPADKFMAYAKQFLGQHYQWGGGHAGQRNGAFPVDCSGLVSQAGFAIGRPDLNGTAETQQNKAKPLGSLPGAIKDLKPGDLVFRNNPADHVGIYIGDGKVLHATGSGMICKIDNLADIVPNSFNCAGRIFDQAGQPLDAPATPGASSGATGYGGPTGGSGGGGDVASVGGGGSPSRMSLPSSGGGGASSGGGASADGGGSSSGGIGASGPSTSGPVDTSDAGSLDGILKMLEALGITKEQLEEICKKNGISLKMLLAVIKQESGGNPNATSPAGAKGLMQLMPATAAGLGVTNPADPLQSIQGGAKYLGDMLKQQGGDVSLALAAYNAGPGNVQKYGGIPPFAETQNYVKNITSSMA